MPNHCENTITITGEQKELKEIWRRFQHKKEKGINMERTLSFEKIMPTPRVLMEQSSPPRKKEDETEEQYQERITKYIRNYGARDWYDWRVKNWGTKWDSYDCFLQEIEPDMMQFAYSTAWSPGKEILQHLSKLYPNILIVLQYHEPGMVFAGSCMFKSGKILKEDYTEDIKEIKELYPDFYEEYEE